MGFERRDASWLTFEQAKGRILLDARRHLLPVEHRAPEDAAGMALAEDVKSTVLLPPWDNSAMDGYAVRGDDVAGATVEHPVELRVVDAVRPGRLPEVPVGAGEAVRIMTGGVLPEGADSVIRVEDTDAEETAGRVVVRADRDRSRNIRPRGEDVRPGATVLERGASLSPARIGVLAALGTARVAVHRRPRVAILSNGDELVDARHGGEDRLRAGAVVDSNGPMLAAAVRAAGGEAVRTGIVPDDRAAVRRSLEDAADADLVVTIGGASMGEADLFKRVLDEMDFRLDFWRVRLRPGSPVGFGRLPVHGAERPDVPLFSLPGNPVSAYVTFQLFVRPFLLAMAGHGRIERPTVRARAAERLGGSEAHEIFLRVRLSAGEGPEWLVSPTGPQGSGIISSIGSADGLAVIPLGVAAIESGQAVDVILLGEGPGWPAGSPGSAEREG
ncbi:MAG: gephyrin-like molybdotransferase Glp [Gemmatimonadota bacterium]